MNYTQLYQAICDYTENYEATFVANIPNFVQQNEERVYRSVMIPELRKNVTGNLTANNKYLARPSDFLSVFSLAVIDDSGTYTYLIDKDVNFIREAYPYTSTASIPSPATVGFPKYYAQFDGDIASASYGNFILGPTPDQSYAVELHYYYDPPSIVTTGTSWLGENAETVLLYGSLVEAYVFMKGDNDLMMSYKSQYDEALQRLGVIDYRSKRDSYRDGEPRVDK